MNHERKNSIVYYIFTNNKRIILLVIRYNHIIYIHKKEYKYLLHIIYIN